MNEPQNTPPITPAEQKPVVKPAPSRALLSRLSSKVQFPLAILITVGVLAYLLWPEGQPADEAASTAPEAETVKLVGQHCLAIEPGTPLEKKLAVAVVEQQVTEAPILNKVIGAVVARMPPPSPPAPLPKGEGSQSPSPLVPPPKGEGSQTPAPLVPFPKGEGSQTPAPPAPLPKGEGRWDFNTPELASAYADWLKARADVPFNEKQLVNIRKLSEETLKAKKEVRDRLEKLVKAGTDPEKDLAAAKADYLQAFAQSQKDEHEALTNLNNAKRTLATLERQLFQAGVDPDLLANNTESTAIVVGEVPEDRIGLVEKGQACTAQFYAFPGETILGTVRSLAPTISKERRTLRVFFQLDDPQRTAETRHVRRNRPGNRQAQDHADPR